jgi:hypothetical protein
MAATSNTEQETPPLWQWVSMADYRPPKASVKVVSENWFATLRNRFHPDDADAESAAYPPGGRTSSRGFYPLWSGSICAMPLAWV